MGPSFFWMDFSIVEPIRTCTEDRNLIFRIKKLFFYFLLNITVVAVIAIDIHVQIEFIK